MDPLPPFLLSREDAWSSSNSLNSPTEPSPLTDTFTAEDESLQSLHASLSSSPPVPRISPVYLAQTPTPSQTPSPSPAPSPRYCLAPPPSPASRVSSAAATPLAALSPQDMLSPAIYTSMPQQRSCFNFDPVALHTLHTQAPSSLTPQVSTPIHSPYPVSDAILTLWQQLQEQTTRIHQEKGIELLPYSEAIHRFTNIHCSTANLVKVKGHTLHANYVTAAHSEMRFIAGQYPLEDPGVRSAFWDLAFQKGSILDLTQHGELNKFLTPYYPKELYAKCYYNHLMITCVAKQPLASDVQECWYELRDTGTLLPKRVRRIHYSGWTDHASTSLERMSLLVAEVAKHPDHTPYVHCKAGMGRTGTFIAGFLFLERVRKGQITEENLIPQLFEHIQTLRMQRGPGFIQSPMQLQLLIQFAKSKLNAFIEEQERLLQHAQNPQAGRHEGKCNEGKYDDDDDAPS